MFTTGMNVTIYAEIISKDKSESVKNKYICQNNDPALYSFDGICNS